MHSFEPRPSRPSSRPLTLVATAAAATTALLVAVHPQLRGEVWSRGDDLALIVAWGVALVASAWLFVTSGACALAVGIGRPDAARRLAPALPVALRRLVEVAVVATCVALPALPASASTTSSTTFPVVADQPVVRAPVVASPAPPPSTPAATTERVVVRPGDNLWLITRRSLTRVSGRRPTDAEVMRHWLVVITANRSTLRSGDPSLVFPGEIVTVPAATAVS